MNVWIVRVGMPHRLVNVFVRVRLAGFLAWRMLMPMVLVVMMRVLVIHRRVHMSVLMMLRQMQPGTDSHEHPGQQQGGSHRRAQCDCKRCA